VHDATIPDRWSDGNAAAFKQIPSQRNVARRTRDDAFAQHAQKATSTPTFHRGDLSRVALAR
jgi:hypothetical protein